MWRVVLRAFRLFPSAFFEILTEASTWIPTSSKEQRGISHSWKSWQACFHSHPICVSVKTFWKKHIEYFKWENMMCSNWDFTRWPEPSRWKGHFLRMFREFERDVVHSSHSTAIARVCRHHDLAVATVLYWLQLLSVFIAQWRNDTFILRTFILGINIPSALKNVAR